MPPVRHLRGRPLVGGGLIGLLVALAIVFLSKPAALMLITGYQNYISPHKGFSCAYHAAHPDSPSCSAYAYQTIDTVGVVHGYRLVWQRLHQCHRAWELMTAAAATAKATVADGQVSDECSAACDNSCKQPCSDCSTGVSQWLMHLLSDLWEDIRAMIKNLLVEVARVVMEMVRTALETGKQLLQDSWQAFQNALFGIFGTVHHPEPDQIRQDLPFAYMSECAYSSARCGPFLKELEKTHGWRQPTSLPITLGSSVEYALFRKQETIAIAFRGSEPLSTDLDDWINNLGSAAVARLLDMSVPALCKAAGRPDCEDAVAPTVSAIEQDIYKDAVESFARAQVEAYGKDNVIFTGHSKGGGEALWASKQTGARAIVFNPRSEFGTAEIYRSKQARGYYLEGEILSFGRFRDRKELVKIPYKDITASPIDRHTMLHMIRGMKMQAGFYSAQRDKPCIKSKKGDSPLFRSYSLHQLATSR